MKRLTIFNSSSNGARVSESLSSTNHPLAANSAADCAFNAMNAIVVVTFSPSLPLFSPCTRFSERQFRSSSRQIRTLSPQPKDNSCAETVDPFCPERERERERERQRERERERERERGRERPWPILVARSKGNWATAGKIRQGRIIFDRGLFSHDRDPVARD